MSPQSGVRVVLWLVPLTMSVARRSAVIMLFAAALFTFFKERKSARSLWQAANFDPILLFGLTILIAWGAISLLWSPLPLRGLKQLVFDFALPVTCGLWMLCIPVVPATRNETRWIALGLALAASLVMAQLYFQFRIEALFGYPDKHAEMWRFNMVVVTYALFVPALLAIARREPLVVTVSLIAIGGAVLLSQSATSKLALGTAIIVYMIAHLIPRKYSLLLFGFIVLSLLALQPWQGLLVDQILKVTNIYASIFSSGKERIIIWQATGEMTLHGLPWGFGMGSSDAISETSLAKTMPPEVWVGLRQTHAHNAFLNILLELGLPGLAGMALVGIGVIRSLARSLATAYAPSLALAAQVVVVDLISHGAWQAWWFTAIMLGLLALRQHAPALDHRA